MGLRVTPYGQLPGAWTGGDGSGEGSEMHPAQTTPESFWKGSTRFYSPSVWDPANSRYLIYFYLNKRKERQVDGAFVHMWTGSRLKPQQCCGGDSREKALQPAQRKEVPCSRRRVSSDQGGGVSGEEPGGAGSHTGPESSRQ